MSVYDCYQAPWTSTGNWFGPLKRLNYEHPKDVAKEIKRLFQHFGVDVALGEVGYAPCNSWRAERLQLADGEQKSRFANRVHIYESWPDRESAGGHVAGRYLGYISLRPGDYGSQPFFQYIAVANIAQPRFMLRPRYHIVTCAGGPADGILPFRSVPFCYPNDKSPSRVSCLHAALHGAMLLKAEDFGFTPMNSQDMLAFMWETSTNSKDQEQLLTRGASLQQALDVLRHEQTKAGGILEKFPVSEYVDRLTICKEVWRCMMDYLANGLPLIVIVEEIPGDPNQSHAVLVNGMRLMDDPEDGICAWIEDHERTRIDINELPGRFVIHDILAGPFTEKVSMQLLSSAWVNDLDLPSRSGIYFLAVAPNGARLGISMVRWLAKERCKLFLRQYPRFWLDYVKAVFGVDSPDASEIASEKRYVTRMLLTSQVQERYLRVPDQAPDAIRVPLEQAQHLLQQTAKRHASHESLRDGAHVQRYWWCIEVRVPVLPRPACDQDKNYLGTLPALAYLWPIDIDTSDTTDANAPWVEIVFTGPDPGSGQPSSRVHLCARVDNQTESTVEYVALQHSA